MNYEEKLQNVSVLGAAGKMGSGILLLTAVEMADLQLKPENKAKNFILNAIDVSPVALSGLYGYLRTQVKKIAEKKVIQLRQVYKDNSELIENSEVIDQYVDDVMKLVLFSTRIESTYESSLIFEAIVEDSDIKVKIFSQILENNKKNPWFLTNTSSVPIAELDSRSGLKGNILGFHFYNPPAVQKLVELITTKNTNKELIEFSKIYAKNLNKKLVPSNDFAGFIGNGHFMRDLLFGIKKVEELAMEMSLVEAVYTVNRVSQDFLIRPMGIFQLMDYVGVDVCQKILQVMKSRLKDENLHSFLIDKLISLGIKGGQNSDGSQKSGIFLYEKGKPAAIYDSKKKDYDHIEAFRSSIDIKLGKLPTSHKPWKDVIANKQRDEFLKNYFKELSSLNTFGSKLAMEYHINSKNIGLNLVKEGIADNDENVNTVMLTGFFHAYGPINSFLD
ncbi:MAG: 3-hydroxyacyl-CoA dehydrogenase family protein [Bacteroidales bacterium]|nr:3-hydroxyacyl-CoA dehydrogenase family protein [Bacteroidales bacterium]